MLVENKLTKISACVEIFTSSLLILFYMIHSGKKRSRLVHVIRMFCDKPFVCSNRKLSQTSWQYIRPDLFGSFMGPMQL